MIRFSPRGCGRIEMTTRIAAVALAAVAFSLLGSSARAADIAPPEAIGKAGRIVFCSDMTGPPLEFLDESTKPRRLRHRSRPRDRQALRRQG